MSKTKQGNHIYADDDSELDNTCPDCGEFLDRKGKCQSCKDTRDEEEKYERKKDESI